MTGPYAYTRNPLYLGSLVLTVGFAISARSWWIGAGLVLMFLAIYLPVIYGEEVFLKEHFPEFPEYAQRVPRLLPGIRSLGSSAGTFSWALFLKASRIQCDVGGGGADGRTGSKIILEPIAGFDTSLT